MGVLVTAFVLVIKVPQTTVSQLRSYCRPEGDIKDFCAPIIYRIFFASFSFIMVTLWNTADHYIFILSFVLLSSSSFSSSPNLSRRRLDVCHTCTHGVALVRI